MGEWDRLAARVNLADHLEVVFVVEHRYQPLTHDRMIVDHQHSNGRHECASEFNGTRATPRVPSPGALLTVSRPPSSFARSRMPTRPWLPGRRVRGENPRPSSRTDRVSVEPRRRSTISTARAC